MNLEKMRDEWVPKKLYKLAGGALKLFSFKESLNWCSLYFSSCFAFSGTSTIQPKTWVSCCHHENDHKELKNEPDYT